MGDVEVPADRYWGAQTQRSLQHFSIGDDHMPKAVYHAYGYVKKAAALVNAKAGRLEQWRADAIIRAADEVIAGKLDEHFPLYVWQTGSGTQSNMNVNEVHRQPRHSAARRDARHAGADPSQRPRQHGPVVERQLPDRDAHRRPCSRSTEHMLPALDRFATAIEAKANEWMDVVKTGRTHLQDAVPLTVGQEWSGYAAQVRDAMDESCVGRWTGCTGSPAAAPRSAPGSTRRTAFGRHRQEIAELTGKPFVTAPNKFAAQGSLDAMVAAMAAVRGLAVALMKIANDMRWLASGPRCGLGELLLPQNEPGSSIMPGKVNPTQCEAMVMVCIQVIGEDNAVGFAGSQGNFELNAMRPIIINNSLHSIRIIGDMCDKMRTYSIEGTELNRARIDASVGQSLMLVTALTPVIGYDNAAQIAETANADGSTLKEAALKSGKVDEKTFDDVVDPRKLVGEGVQGA